MLTIFDHYLKPFLIENVTNSSVSQEKKAEIFENFNKSRLAF